MSWGFSMSSVSSEEIERTEPDRGAGIELPAPTSLPLYFALGVALAFAGLVTHFLVSIIGGVLAVFGAIGWWREVLPNDHEEVVALQSEAECARPILPRTAAVEHLVIGREKHRMRLPVEARPLSAGLRGGFAGSFTMAAIACMYGFVAHQSVWLPINLLAGVVLPGVAHADFARLLEFDGAAFAVATLLHLTLSPLMGLVYSAVLPMLPGRPLLWGGIVAPLAWTALSWPALGILDPALAEHVSWPWFIASQVGFGLTAGWVISKVEPMATLQALPIAERLGLESPGVGEATYDRGRDT
jgi:hypothetical protein